MLIAARDFPGRYRTLLPEASFGLSWLQKLWRPAQKVLYIQVGIGTGNASNTIQGDYNFWFLPQQEDRLNVKPGGNPGPTAYFVKYRPVFAAAPPGQKIDPDLAGRFAADFALGAQLAARTDRSRAEHLLALARGIYAMAKTTHVGNIVTAFPHDFYPGTEWKSDMLWGAAEIALADEALHAPGPGAERRPADRGEVGEGLSRAGPPRGRRHAEPVRQRRDRRGRPAPGHAARAGPAGRRPWRDPGRPRRTAQAGRERSPGRPVPARLGPGRQRRHAARVRPVHHQRAVPALRRLRRVPGVRAAAAELRARRERLGQLLRRRRGQHVPALHAERDRQPGRLADRAGQHPARGHRGRPEQPGQLRRPRHRGRDAGLPRGPLQGRSTPPPPPTRTTWSAGPRSSPPPTTRPTRCWPSRSAPRPEAGTSTDAGGRDEMDG